MEKLPVEEEGKIREKQKGRQQQLVMQKSFPVFMLFP